MAVARALFRYPAIVILDEAASALDSLTERKVSDALEAAGRNRTVITISHCLSIFEKCDYIFVLSSDQIAEQGSYKELCNDRDSLLCSLLR